MFVINHIRKTLILMQEPTIGAAFFTQLLSLNEATVKFDIWDTAGQERYHSLAPMYYRGAAAAVVVYDISNVVVICSTSYSCIWLFTSLGADSLRLMLLWDECHRKRYKLKLNEWISTETMWCHGSWASLLVTWMACCNIWYCDQIHRNWSPFFFYWIHDELFSVWSSSLGFVSSIKNW